MKLWMNNGRRLLFGSGTTWNLERFGALERWRQVVLDGATIVASS
jgi:hypothetical protein